MVRCVSFPGYKTNNNNKTYEGVTENEIPKNEIPKMITGIVHIIQKYQFAI